MQAVKLGKLSPRHDPRTLQFAQYLPSSLPKPADSCDWSPAVKNWPMMANDRLGDCTCAAAGHLIQDWSFNRSQKDPKPFPPFTPTDAQIVAAYSQITGYNSATGENDNGAVELDVLKFWKKHGIAGQKISAYVALEPGNLDHVKYSIILLGGCYIGVSLPLSAQNQPDVWSVVGGHSAAPGSWGGHAVCPVGYDLQFVYFISWGKLMKMTWQFWLKYVDEAYAILSPEWIESNKVAPSGFRLDQIQADLKLI